VSAPGRWTRWVAWVQERETGETLALLRIAMGLAVIGTISTVVAHDLVPFLWLDAASGGYREVAGHGFLYGIIGVTPATVWGGVALGLLSGLLVTLGLGGRLPAFIALKAIQELTDLNGSAGGSYDALLTNALWLLVLGDATRTLSLDCYHRTGRWRDDTPILAIPRRLFLFQLVLVYWSTGAQKVSNYWTPFGGFSALYYILQQPTWHRADMAWVAWIYPLTQVMTAMVWLFELSAPLLLVGLWARRWPEGRLSNLARRLPLRGMFAVFGVGMHLGIEALMNVGPFSFISISYYLALLWPSEARAVSDRLTRAVSPKATPG
jgi:hypothetical protein